MEDRRRQPRRNAGGLFIVCDKQTGAAIGQVVNLTELGAMLLSAKPTKPDFIHQCKMTLPEMMHGHESFIFEAEIKWCLLDKKTGMYRIGFEFRNMTPDKQAITQELLESWSFSQSTVVET